MINPKQRAFKRGFNYYICITNKSNGGKKSEETKN